MTNNNNDNDKSPVDVDNDKYKRTKIKCVETGQIYDSASQVAHSLNATRGAMSNHLAGRIPSLRGLTFVRIEENDEKTYEQLDNIKFELEDIIEQGA